MAQGIAYDKDKVIELLKPHLQRGCSVTKACAYCGIPQSTVATWVADDETLRLQISVWQNQINATARDNIAKEIAKGNLELSMKWLEKKEKDEFSNRQEVTGADNAPIFPTLAEIKQFEKDWFEADTTETEELSGEDKAEEGIVEVEEVETNTDKADEKAE